jgi:hypothetical protein
MTKQEVMILVRKSGGVLSFEKPVEIGKAMKITTLQVLGNDLRVYSETGIMIWENASELIRGLIVERLKKDFGAEATASIKL